MQPEELRSKVGPLISEFAYTFRFYCPPFLNALGEYHFAGEGSMLPMQASSRDVGRSVRFSGEYPGVEADNVLWLERNDFELASQNMVIKRTFRDENGSRLVDILTMSGVRFQDIRMREEEYSVSPEKSFITPEIKTAQDRVDSHITAKRFNLTYSENPDMLDVTGGILVGIAQDSRVAFQLARELMDALMAYGYKKGTDLSPGSFPED